MWLRLAMRSTSALLLSLLLLLLLLCFNAHHVSGNKEVTDNTGNVVKQEDPSSNGETSVRVGNVTVNSGRNWMVTVGQWIKVRRKPDGGIEVFVVKRPDSDSEDDKTTTFSSNEPESADENDIEEFKRRRRRQVLPVPAYVVHRNEDS